MLFEYEAIVVEQTAGGKKLAVFSAPATHIGQWSGIPQKKKFTSGDESAGFQREESPSRLKSISEFLKNPENTIQNPLLCAIRDAHDCSHSFIPKENSSSETIGIVRIEMPDFDAMPLVELFSRVKQYIEARVPELNGRRPSDKFIAKIQAKAREEGVELSSEAIESDGQNGEIEEDDGSAAIFDQSHIEEFWEEISARLTVLSKLESYQGDEFLGFNREALESYLKPVVIVDGQHRLKGALLAARDSLNNDEAKIEAEQLIDQGAPPDDVEKMQLDKRVRSMPVTLLMDSNPAEHVFQFVVVNQKATPIGRALLGTIVSTSLTDDELSGVADRLRDAGIPLDESRAASYMARHSSSPFCGLVELGMMNDQANIKLPWAVFVSLVNVFKELKNGTPFHDSTDYAVAWKRNHLDDSGIVSEFAEKEYSKPFEYWRSIDGPWKSVFICFWTAIRDKFSNTTDDSKRNYWGNPRRSNLFNKVSLNILAADFFKYLRQVKKEISDLDDLQAIISSWLEGVDPGYFDREWELEKTGVKKDSPGIKRKWAKLWDEYRSSPDRLPQRTSYRSPSLV